MNVRSQVSMVFHLDKCIGCHTCSIACKNIWTDRSGTEYMWWNNIETKPGTGYPIFWENQSKYKGGWKPSGGKLRLKLQGRLKTLANIFYNPRLPMIDDYYEPWNYRYEDLFNAPEGDDQPTARPISAITGQPIDIRFGPNWDDDFGGSTRYATKDPNLEALSEEQRQQFLGIERMILFYLPRICNHCLNASCVAACPAGAIYKRGEDGIVLVNQEKCRSWRMCISACPYKKVYYNWSTGVSEKCILCYPRLETGQPPACFHSCVGRIRYMGVLLYDADRITEIAMNPNEKLVEAQRSIILDPFDENVVKKAQENGVHMSVIKAARDSPVYKFVKLYELAFPLHPEFRTLPMLYYVPPLLPMMSSLSSSGTLNTPNELFSSLEHARIPIKYFASLFSAGNESLITDAYKKLMAVRLYKRAQNVKDIGEEEVAHALEEAHVSPEQAETIYGLTALAPLNERFVIPPMMRENDPERPFVRKGQTGLGFRLAPKRRW